MAEFPVSFAYVFPKIHSDLKSEKKCNLVIFFHKRADWKKRTKLQKKIPY